jgi:heme-degrading monooxygenase HmoA
VFITVSRFSAKPRDVDFDALQEQLERDVLPEVRHLNGYEGCYLLRAGYQEGMLLLLWETEDAAAAARKAGASAEALVGLLELMGKRLPSAGGFDVTYADHPVE